MKKLIIIAFMAALLVPALTHTAQAADQEDIAKANAKLQTFLTNFNVVLSETKEMTNGLGDTNQNSQQQVQFQNLTTPTNANLVVNEGIEVTLPAQPVEMTPAPSP